MEVKYNVTGERGHFRDCWDESGIHEDADLRLRDQQL